MLLFTLQDGRGCNVEQRVFEALAERKFPRLLEVFDRLECSMGRLTEEWFKCLFVTVLPAETTARVWDCMFVEGPKVLHRVALSLLKVGCRPSAGAVLVCCTCDRRHVYSVVGSYGHL